jgi:hypothetical protein
MSVVELIEYLEIEKDLERTRKCVRVLFCLCLELFAD